MPTCYETDEQGNTYQWEMGEGQCPNCGAPCSYNFGVDNTPDRILCPFCGYQEGYGIP